MVGTNWKGIGMAQRRWINLQAIELRLEIVGAKNAASRSRPLRGDGIHQASTAFGLRGWVLGC